MIPASLSRPAELPLTRFLWAPPALLFVAASLSKICQPLTFLHDLSNYGFHFTPVLEGGSTLFLPALELFIGLTLLFRPSVWGAVVTGLLLIVFSLGIFGALPSGYLHHCGCLGAERLNPTFALLKNALALVFLIAGFFPSKRKLPAGNAWGAFAVLLAASGVHTGTLIMSALGLLLASRHGKKCIWLFLLGLALGWLIKLAAFPPLVGIAAAAAFFFIFQHPRPSRYSQSLILAVAAFILTLSYFLWPASPPLLIPRLRLNAPLPSAIHLGNPPSQNKAGEALLVFLQPDCEDCRDWLPLITSLSQGRDWPPVISLAPGVPPSIAAFRDREKIPFDVQPVSSPVFSQYIRRTPLAVLWRDGRIIHIFAEGSIPTPSQLAAAIQDE